MGKCYVEKVTKVFKNEVGYQEKASNKNLDSKHTNVGKANYTKYGRDMGCNGQSWCDACVDWCFVKAYGEKDAKRLLGGFSNYTPTSAQYFKNKKQYFKRGEKTPKEGDVIFFHSNSLGRIAHTGYVYKVLDKKVYSIEGNTSSNSSEFERDGGCVAYKIYSLKDTRIDGYGRPKYDKKPSNKVKIKTKCRLYKSNTITKGYYGTLSANKQIEFISDVKKGWSKVKAVIGEHTYTGYVKNSCINKTGLSKYQIGKVKIKAYLRKKNSIKSDKIKSVKVGTKVTIISVGKYWTNVKVNVNGKNIDGFISTKKLTIK